MKNKEVYSKILMYSVMSFIGGLFLFMVLVNSVDTHINPLKLISFTLSESVYRTVSYYETQDNVSKEIVRFCSPRPIDAQVECVISELKPNYNYTLRNGSKVKTPSDFFYEGGLCRDNVVFFATIFREMGWITYYNFNVPNHVYLQITKRDVDFFYRCDLDGTNYHCNYYNVSTTAK